MSTRRKAKIAFAALAEEPGRVRIVLRPHDLKNVTCGGIFVDLPWDEAMALGEEIQDEAASARDGARRSK